MQLFIQTERLYLRNLCPADAKTLHRYRNDAACAKFQRWEDTSVAAVRALIERFEDCVFLSDQQEQHYAVCTAEGTCVGDLTVFYTAGDCITLGITVAPEYHRRGIAREILTAVIPAVQNRYPALDLVALIDPENEPSIALFEGVGFYRVCYAPSIASCVYQIDGRK